MPGLLGELLEEHRSIAEILDCLDRQVRRFETGEPPDFDVIAAALAYFEGFPGECHHPKEDLVYERLCRRDKVSAWIVGDLASAHARLAEDLRTFSAAISAVQHEAELPRDALVRWARRFIERQRLHMAMEEASFFPAAERALTEEDGRELQAAVSYGPGSSKAARYETIRRSILAWDKEDRVEAEPMPSASG